MRKRHRECREKEESKPEEKKVAKKGVDLQIELVREARINGTEWGRVAS